MNKTEWKNEKGEIVHYIRIIDLLNKIANGEKVPQEIKINSRIFNFCDTCKTYEDEYGRDLAIKWNELNQEVEILEDNTEEIEQCDFDISKVFQDLDIVQVSQFTAGIVDKLNEIIDEVNELVKEVNSINKKIK